MKSSKAGSPTGKSVNLKKVMLSQKEPVKRGASKLAWWG
jgi:hypothetical protein